MFDSRAHTCKLFVTQNVKVVMRSRLNSNDGGCHEALNPFLTYIAPGAFDHGAGGFTPIRKGDPK